MSGIKALQQALGTFNPISREQEEIETVLKTLIQTDTQPLNEKCFSGLNEDVGVELLYSDTNMKGPTPTTHFRIMKVYSIMKWMTHESDSQNQRTVNDLVIHLF